VFSRLKWSVVNGSLLSRSTLSQAEKKCSLRALTVYYPTDTNLKDLIKFILCYLTDSQVIGEAVKPNISF